MPEHSEAAIGMRYNKSEDINGYVRCVACPINERGVQGPRVEAEAGPIAHGLPMVSKLHIVGGLHPRLPFEYYTLPFCKPTVIERKHETLGEILMGDRIETSNYNFNISSSIDQRL